MPAVSPFTRLFPPEYQTSKVYSALMDSVWSGWTLALDTGSQLAAGQCFLVRIKLYLQKPTRTGFDWQLMQ